jgi:hypothetical protein
MPLPYVLVLRIQVPDRSIIKQHALLSPNHIVKRGLREIGCGDGRPPNCDCGSSGTGGSLRLDLRLVVSKKDEETSLGSCMLNRDSHEVLDQLG